MNIATAHVPTPNGAKYMQQLCKHRAQKLPVELGERSGTVTFNDAVARFRADEGALLVTVEAADEAILDRMQEVVAKRLDRFAFREAPLAFDWTRG